MVKTDQINGFCASKYTVLKRCNALTSRGELRKIEAVYNTQRIALSLSLSLTDTSTAHTTVTTHTDPNISAKSKNKLYDKTQNDQRSNLENKLKNLLQENEQAVLTICEKIEKENAKIDFDEESQRGIWVQDPSKFNLEKEMEILKNDFHMKIEKLEINYKIYSSEMFQNCENEKLLNERKIRNSGKEFQVVNSPLNQYLRERNLDFTELDEFSVSEVILQEKNSLHVMCERVIEEDFRILCEEKTEISLILSLTPYWGVHSDSRDSHDLLHQKLLDRIVHHEGESALLSSLLSLLLLILL